MAVKTVRVKGGVQVVANDGRMVFLQLKDIEQLAFDLQRIAREWRNK